MALPSGEHNWVSVYAITPNGKEFRMIQNLTKKNPDCYQNPLFRSGHLELSAEGSYWQQLTSNF